MRTKLWARDMQNIHAGKEHDQRVRAAGSLEGKTGCVVWD